MQNTRQTSLTKTKQENICHAEAVATAATTSQPVVTVDGRVEEFSITYYL